MSVDLGALLAELRQESDHLIDHLKRLTPEQWNLRTPAPGWTIRDQVSHLAFFDDTARLALTDPETFRIEADALMAGGMDFPDRIAAEYHTSPPETLLAWFIKARNDLLDALDGDDPRRRLPWFGPDMSVASSATARLMETWAHGQDIYDTIGVSHPPSSGLRSIAHLGVVTFGFAHVLNGLAVPDEPIRCELLSPDGDRWTWGPEDAINRITGPAEDFVLTVTQRRHWTETGLSAEGPVARDWLEIAQVFAGAPSRRAVRR